MFKCKYRVYSAKKDEIKGIKTNNQKLTNKQKKIIKTIKNIYLKKIISLFFCDFCHLYLFLSFYL